jgi:hypothetical protein
MKLVLDFSKRVLGLGLAIIGGYFLVQAGVAMLEIVFRTL